MTGLPGKRSAMAAASYALGLWVACAAARGQGVSAAHACSNGYYAPGTATITCAFAYPSTNQLWLLLWVPALPAGWTLGTATGDGNPEIVAGEIVFAGALSGNPIRFAYTVMVPPGDTGPKAVRGTVSYLLDGMVNPEAVPAQPDPLGMERVNNLIVASAYGGAEPPAGTNVFLYGTNLACRVTNSPVYAGSQATQYWCAGATVMGNDYTPVNPTNVTLQLTNDAQLIWQWATNYYLATEVSGSGTVDVASGWQAAGSNLTITATADAHWHFQAWAGDIDGGNIVSNLIAMPMGGPRHIVAAFDVDRHALVVDTPFGTASPGTLTNVAHGSTVPQNVSPPLVVSTNAGERFRLLGPEVTGAGYSTD